MSGLEAAGLVVGTVALVSLLDSCRSLADLLKKAKEMDTDCDMLCDLFRFAQKRLTDWSVDFKKLLAGGSTLDCDEVIVRAIQQTKRLVKEIEEICKRYGPRIPGDSDAPEVSQRRKGLERVLARISPRSRPELKSRGSMQDHLKWAVRDENALREKLEYLNAFVTELVLATKGESDRVANSRGLLQGCLHRLHLDKSRQHGIKHVYRKGACQWLESDGKYQAWVNLAPDSSPCLYLKGKAGSGKSVVMHAATKHVRKRARQLAGAITISHFFDARNQQASKLKHSCSGLVQNLLHQVLTKVDKHAHWKEDFLDRLKKKLPQGQSEAMTYAECLTDALHHVPQPFASVWTVIDALDESGPDFETVWPLLQRLTEDHQGNIKVRLFVSFRTVFKQQNFLQSAAEAAINLAEHNGEDITAYVHARLKDHLADEARRQNIAVQLIKRSKNVFLWVHLVTQKLIDLGLNTSTGEEQQEQLDKLLEELDALFDSALGPELSPVDRKPAEFVLQSMLFAARPMRLGELRHAIFAGKYIRGGKCLSGFETRMTLAAIRDRVVRACGGLVEESSGDDPCMQFIHDSVRQWLLDCRVTASGMAVLNPDLSSNLERQSHFKLLQVCLQPIDQDPFEEAPLLQCREYATTFWAEHAQQCRDMLEKSLPLATNVLTFCSSTKTAQMVESLQIHIRNYGSSAFFSAGSASSLLAILSAIGITTLFQQHMTTCTCWRTDCSLMDAVLFNASTNGHHAILSILIASQPPHADSDANSSNNDSSKSNNNSNNNSQSALHSPANAHHALRNVTPLYRASYRGYTEAVRVLLALGAQPDAPTLNTWTYPLHVAAAYGHVDVVEVLLGHQAVDAKRELRRVHSQRNGMTPVQVARRKGMREAVAVLEAWEARVGEKEEEGRGDSSRRGKRRKRRWWWWTLRAR